MKLKAIHFLIILISLSVVACNNESKSEPGNAAAASVESGREEKQDEPKQTTVDDNSLIPYKMLADRLNKEARGFYGVNTDSMALLRFEFDRKSVPSLQLQVEPQRDPARLERMMQAWIYNPDLLQEFDAGDQALLLHTKSKPNSYYTLIFRVKHHFCSIVSTHLSDGSPEEGLLYNKEALMQLARDWALHLSKLES